MKCKYVGTITVTVVQELDVEIDEIECNEDGIPCQHLVREALNKSECDVLNDTVLEYESVDTVGANEEMKMDDDGNDDDEVCCPETGCIVDELCDPCEPGTGKCLAANTEDEED